MHKTLPGRARGAGREARLNAKCDQTGGISGADKFPQITGSELVKFLESTGFRVTRVKGSHVRLAARDGRATTVPIHAHRQLPKGLLHGIIHELGIDRNDFLRLWSCYEQV
ncbi:MAG: type II toxin-antitoxin system HicA family toxin [Halobacteriota archaeon]